MARWATEREACAEFGIDFDRFEHCERCHQEMDEGDSPTEVDLPDGRVATCCCAVTHEIDLRKRTRLEKPGD